MTPHSRTLLNTLLNCLLAFFVPLGLAILATCLWQMLFR